MARSDCQSVGRYQETTKIAACGNIPVQGRAWIAIVRQFPFVENTFARSAMVIAVAVAWAVGCGDFLDPPPDAPRPTTVTVSPATAELVALNATVQLTAQVQDQNGQVMSGATVTWASSATAVATVDATGLVTAAANGAVAITAAAGEATGSAAVTVAQVVGSVTVAPAEADFAALGDTLRLTAEAFDANGHAVAGAEFSWGTSDDAVATVDATGLVTAAANGAVAITAAAGEATGSAAVTVAQVVGSVTVAPDTATFVEGDTLRLAATATDANGHLVTAVEFVWWSGDTAVAVVDTSGLVTGVGAGRVQVTATSAAVTGRAQLTVVALAPTTVAVTPDTAVLTALGQTAQFTAVMRDQNGQVLPNASVSWSSGDAGVAVVDASGLVTAEGTGTATITATSGEASGSAVVKVERVAASIVVSPSAPTIAPGDTLRLVADAYDENGHLIENAQFAWSSSDPSVAMVAALGLVQGIAEGTATITATVGQATGTAEITVEGSDDRAALEALYNATGGPNWERNENWLTDTSLSEWQGVETDGAGRVVVLVLSYNGLSGQIPPEIGGLTGLTRLSLSGNDLTGGIPRELGGLSRLRVLVLAQNRLTGSIPSELGNLSSLGWLGLGSNRLTGEIPPELGRLAVYGMSLEGNQLTGEVPAELGQITGLQQLWLGRNRFTGSIPPELGALHRLRQLRVPHNELTGSVPPELGALTSLDQLDLSANALTGNLPAELSGLGRLRTLHLSNNADMSGALPMELTSLELNSLRLTGTGICIPRDSEFRNWFLAIPDRHALLCPAGSAAAYLTQAVQSLDFPVPLVAGEDALLRVFVTVGSATDVHIPPMRATFFDGDREVFVSEFAGPAVPIPTDMDEGNLELSANVMIPGSVLVPQLEMVVDVDPEGILDSTLKIQRRIPETGRLPVGVQAVPTFDLMVVPFLRETNPDSTVMDTVNALSPDDELFWMTRTLLPIEDMGITVHEPVWTSSANARQMLEELRLLKVAEGGTEYYLGTVLPRIGGGVAFPAWGVAFADLVDFVVAHELGHTLSLAHAPCGNPLGVDPLYPYADGSIGAWGYEARSNELVPPDTPELMGYCGSDWISDYHFAKAFGHRLLAESASATAGAAEMSLLLWGGEHPDGAPFLEPAFVAVAPPALPERDGAHRLTGWDEGGTEVFSLSFDMEPIADGDGGASFVFSVPVRPDWAGALARIALESPGGITVMDRDGKSVAALLRDPVTGILRGVLRDWPPDELRPLHRLLSGAGGLEVQVSRGVPGAEAWRW